ncbi:MAG: hypothetical protein WCW13_02495 [archaeon]
MIDLRAELNPIRMVLSRREPVELMIELNNNSNKSQMISIEIYAGDQLAFDKGGRVGVQSKKIIEFKAGERLRDYYNIFPRPNATPSAQIIQVVLSEHFNNSFQYVQSKKVKELTLRID